jgi:hypothetical protein
MSIPVRAWSPVLIAPLALACAAGAAGTPKDGPLAKLAPELQALHQAYVAGQRTGVPLAPADPLVRVVEGRVVIDAVAAGDPGTLQRDLVALGMRQAVAAGRIVSGQLPVASLAAMAALPSLQFARAATATTR